MKSDPHTQAKPRRSKLAAARRVLTRLHRDERGAEGLEKLLIVAAIVLPLLGVLIFFRDDLEEWVRGEWDDKTQRPGTGTTP